uniref:NAC transcription factor n=1 Tax=Diospyros kaki TaxID=35925 RepID=A0A0B5HB66_DIOKA|nr:NAC transcription factor [Diospyros kaki]
MDKLEELVLPSGYRFSPTDPELVVHYLIKKIVGRGLPANIIKHIKDLYKYDPLELPISEFKYGNENEAYFYTHIQQKDSHGSQQVLDTPSGYWREIDLGDFEVFYGWEIVGLKRSMAFYEGEFPNGKRADWVIDEYSVNPRLIPLEKTKGCVVCRIRYGGSSNKSEWGSPLESPLESDSDDEVQSRERNSNLTSNSIDNEILSEIEDHSDADRR